MFFPRIPSNKLFSEVEATEGYRLTVELRQQTISTPSGGLIRFDIESALKERLLAGLDDIGITLESSDLIKEYETRRAKQRPWLFPDIDL